MGEVVGVVLGKWRQLYLNNNKKLKNEYIYIHVIHIVKYVYTDIGLPSGFPIQSVINGKKYRKGTHHL